MDVYTFKVDPAGRLRDDEEVDVTWTKYPLRKPAGHFVYRKFNPDGSIIEQRGTVEAYRNIDSAFERFAEKAKAKTPQS